MTSTMPLPTHQEVESFLHSLGSDSFRVAATLTQMGARGEPKNPYSCPVQSALAAQFPGHRMSANPFDVWFFHPESRGAPVLKIRTPVPVSDFILSFDRGGFSHLARREETS